jgi:hypothetical protein
MKKLFKSTVVLALLSPILALAQTGGWGNQAPSGAMSPTGLPDVSWGTGVPSPGTDKISQILSLVSYWLVVIATIIIAIGLITFLWGVVQYITAGSDEAKRGEARNMMIYGIIALFVMVSVWGLVYFLGSIVGIRPGGGTELPGVPAVLGPGGPTAPGGPGGVNPF